MLGLGQPCRRHSFRQGLTGLALPPARTGHHVLRASPDASICPRAGFLVLKILILSCHSSFLYLCDLQIKRGEHSGQCWYWMREQHKAFNYFSTNMAGILAEDLYPRITAWAHRELLKQSSVGNQMPKLCTTSSARNYPHPQKPAGSCLVRATEKHLRAELRPRLQALKLCSMSLCLGDAPRRAEPGHSSSAGMLPSPLGKQKPGNASWRDGDGAEQPGEGLPGSRREEGSAPLHACLLRGDGPGC